MAGRSTRSKKQLTHEQLEQETTTRWTTSLTKILVDLIVHKGIKENKQSRLFGKKSWKSICSGFQQQTGLDWDIEELKNQHVALRSQYVFIKSLLASKYFQLDESVGIVISKTDLWEKYVKDHPDAETLWSNGSPIYKELCAIFSESPTNGVLGLREGVSVSIPRVIMFEGEISSSESEEIKLLEKQVQDQSVGDNARKRGRKGIDDVIAKGILEMAAASKLTTAAIKKCNERYCIEKCIRALDELQGIEEEVYFAAIDLFNNRHAREAFLSLKVDKRLIWLCRKFVTLRNS